MSPVAAPLDDEDVSTMGQSVQACRSEQRLLEKVRPLCEVAVAGEEDAAALVALADDVVEVLGGGRAQGLEPEVVEDEEVGTEVALQTSFEGAIGPSPIEVGQHLVGVEKEDIEALAASLVGQGVGQVGLSASIDIPPLDSMLSAR